MRSRRLFTPMIAAFLGLTITVSGCASAIEPERPDGSPDPSGAADELLTTVHPATVLDDGSGAELCLGGVAESYPPQCGGPVLAGWDWADHEGDFEEASGVRWGSFIVTGSYDAEAETFTPTEVESGTGYEWPETDDDQFASPCPEPDGGWRVLDEAKTTEEAMEGLSAFAERLEGYAGLWYDQSPNPASDAPPGEDTELAMNDPRLTIVNVRVTGDPEAAETELRTVWGGMLCVTAAERTSAELNAVMEEIMDQFGAGPGDEDEPPSLNLLTVGPDEILGIVELGVIYDDGALQEQFDERWGEGVVRVSSALRPATA